MERFIVILGGDFSTKLYKFKIQYGEIYRLIKNLFAVRKC